MSKYQVKYIDKSGFTRTTKISNVYTEQEAIDKLYKSNSLASKVVSVTEIR